MPPPATQQRTTPPHPLAPLAAPIVWFCLRIGLPATFFTLLSLPFAVGALLLLMHGHILWALPVVFAAAVLDAVDGAVARQHNQTSPAGGYLDSMMDRFVDLLVLLGIMLAASEPRTWIAGMLALFGTLTTSAAKWRLQQERPGANLGRDPFARTDRYIVILVGLLVVGMLAGPHQATGLFVLLVVLAAATNLSVLVNTWRAWRTLRS